MHNELLAFLWVVLFWLFHSVSDRLLVYKTKFVHVA